MTAVLLHLSDIHIKTPHDAILQKAEDIAACVYSSLPSALDVFVVVSGDVAYSGEDNQYSLATKFLNEVRAAIQKETASPVSFIIAPGNHDCDFSQDSGTRKMLLKSIDESEAPEIDSSVIDNCTAIQKPFFNFRDILEGESGVQDDLLWRSSRFTVEGKILQFDCLNISWVSRSREEPGRMYFPIQLYSGKKTENVDLRFLVMHHPLNWFNQSIYRPFRTFVRQVSDIIISGHEHQGNVGLISEAETGMSAYIEGCVLQGEKDLSDSSFNVVVINLSQAQFMSTRYSWDGTRYIKTEDGSWSDYHSLPVKQIKPFAITKTFQDILDDPGAFLKHPGHVNIALPDIFIYPDLRKMSTGTERQKKVLSSTMLLSSDATAKGVLIEGEEKSGRTSLLYQLYRQYHDRGFVPILLKGKDLKKTHDSEIDVIIKRAVEAQYGKSQATDYEQLPSQRKLLLIDDFDDGPVKAGVARADLLSAMKKRFGHLVITVSEMFEMRELLDGDAARELIELVHYKILPFGYARRSQLIEQWFSIGADGTIDEATFISRCDQAERLVGAVMAKTLIPSVPLYLLTLLQSMEAGRTGDFKESALGYYYQYLLTQAFHNSGVRPDKLTEVFQYAVHLAWEFHRQHKQALSQVEIREFNDRFSKEWHTVDLVPRLELLDKARVLCRVGEDYAFRYPYIYYYLKGQYISENLAVIDIREYIARCCKHLYVRDHANTVLFLAHHSNDDYLLTMISEALHGLFPTRFPVTFNGDTSGIKKLIDDATKLTYSGESPTSYRKRVSAVKDEIDDGRDDVAELEEESGMLSLVAQVTMLFKTTEILGQVLKNQYAKIQRTRKGTLIEELFNGQLRALRDFYDHFERNPDALVAEIEAAIERKIKNASEEGRKVKNLTEKERKVIARKVISGIVQLATFAFVMRAAQGANSENLLEDVRDAVKKNETLAFKLIELGIYLDSPKAIPREKLKQLSKEAEKDLVATKLIRIMVLNRLYMFKTTEQDMQWLNGELDLDIGIQHAITYHHDKQRMIK